MPLNTKPADHPNFPPHGRTGLLLVNLGTPEGTDKKSMRKYLKPVSYTHLTLPTIVRG